MRRPWTILMLALFCCCALYASPANGQVVINEVLQNPEGSNDEFTEYIELYGRPGMDLTGYAIGLMSGGLDQNNNGTIDPGEQVPEIDEAYSLDGQSLGVNGFLVIYNDGAGFTDLTIDPMSNTATFSQLHIPTTDTAGNLENDGSPTFVLVRRRPDHSIDINGMSVYGPNYAFRKDVRHDVDSDGDVDFGMEINTIGTGDVAMMVEHYQMVDDVAWSNGGGKEYVRDRDNEISDTPGFNPDAVSRLRYYCMNPRRGYRTTGLFGGPFSIDRTSIADESFVYGEMLTSIPGPNFNTYNTGVDPMSGLIQTKAPTDLGAPQFDGTCDPEPDDAPNPACVGGAGGVYPMTDINVAGFTLTPGSFNDFGAVTQFRFIPGDFNVDGFVNHIDERLILDRVGRGLDDTTPDSYEGVAYDRYVQQGAEFQKVLMMLEMDMADGATEVTGTDVTAFQALCSVCGVASNAEIRITEYMYTGNGDEFVEFTNMGQTPVDMTGFSYSDSGRISGEFDLSGFGVVAPGESVIMTEGDAARFKLDWNIPGVKVIGGLGDPIGGNLGRGDEINLYDNGGILVDRLTYDDRVFANSPRTSDASGWPCDIAVGANDPSNWRLSQAGGDPQNSYVSLNGDTGNPGTFVLNDCAAGPLPVGACCQFGVCIEGGFVTEAYCTAIGGIYQGDATTCAGVTCPQPSGAIVRITEYMYSGTDGEFFEITNLDTNPVDLTGWRVNDSAAVFVSGLDISSLGTLAVGESAIITEALDENVFRTAWGLAPTDKVVGSLGTAGGNNLGRNDQINVFDASGSIVDRLTYGDQDFPGTIRTQNVSGRPCLLAVGADDIDNWILSSFADSNNSIASTGADIGSPSEYVADTCPGQNPTGACCLLDGSCEDNFSQEVCEGAGGTWQGADTLCVNAECPAPSDQQMRITEWMYSGTGGEYVEFTNVGPTPIDMTDWSYDDNSRLPGQFFLTGFGVVAPGESVVITEVLAATFINDWALAPTVKVLGEYTNNLGRSDEINLFDASGNLVDRLTYGDQDIPGSIRAQNAGGWPCSEALGQNDVLLWSLSSIGDVQNSYASLNGDVGNPGSFVEELCPIGCPTCAGDVNGDGELNGLDVQSFTSELLGAATDPCADTDNDGNVTLADIPSFVATIIAGGSCQ